MDLASERREDRRHLARALALTSAVLLVEVAGGFLSGSLALLADAAHMLADAGALLLSYAAMTLADRRATDRHTFGLHRAEILAAFVNAELLLVLAGLLLWKAWERFIAPPAVESGLMLAVAAGGLGANLAALGLLHRSSRRSLNVRAAVLEVWTDLLASTGVVGAAVAIRWTGWHWIDPAVSAAIAIAILPRTFRLLRESGHILLEGSPGELDLPRLRERVLSIDGVEDVHDLHVWTLTSGLHSASLHIRAAHDSPRGEVLRAVRECLRQEAGVDHATIQVEWGPSANCETTEHEFDERPRQDASNRPLPGANG
jgi:cobalt-zinc-cadmium efflux system protein